MLISIGIDSIVFARDARNATRRALRDLLRRRLDETQHFLLIRPDQNPNVEQHDRAEPRADADPGALHGAVGGRGRA